VVGWRRDGQHSRAVAVACGALLVLPLAVAVVVLHGRPWQPVLDLAMTEVRVRDVGTAHTPLIGLPGRIGTLGRQGSHPGPLSFYALAPGYRLAGSSPWALQVATALVNAVAITAGCWIAHRRGGWRGAVAIAGLFATAEWTFGIAALVEPWNPYLPLLWWLVFLLAVWSVLEGDLALVPVAVAAGSFCAQTHLPYAGLVGGFALVVAGCLARQWVRAPARSAHRRAIARWTFVSVVLAGLLWAPVLVDEARHDPGNLTEIADHLRDPPEPAVGIATGVRLELQHLDLRRLASDRPGDLGSLVLPAGDPRGSTVPGLVLVAVWAASVYGAARLRHRALLHLHAVVAAGVVLAAVSMANIFGNLWPYLMLWAWAVTLLAAFAVAWTAVEVIRRKWRGAWRLPVVDGATVLAAVAAVAFVTVLTTQAADAGVPAPALSSSLDQLVHQTEQALLDGEGTATGRDGRYTVTWTDAFDIGAQGYGLVDALERDGFDAGVVGSGARTMTAHRVIETADATAVIHLATGFHIDEWRRVPGAIEVARADPRSEAQRREYEARRLDAIRRLHDAHLDDIASSVDTNLFAAAVDERLSGPAYGAIRDDLARLLELGGPAAVFLAPAGTAG